MKNVSKLTKSIVIALGLAGLGTTAAIATNHIVDTNESVGKVVAMAKSKISLNEAINIAQSATSGKVIEVEFDQEDDTAQGKYEIELISGDNKIKVDIDANSGEIIKSKQKQMDQDDRDEYSTVINQAGISLTDAMNKATQTVHGQIIEAEFDVEKGQPVYEIKVIKDEQVHKIVIDAASGNVLNQ